MQEENIPEIKKNDNDNIAIMIYEKIIMCDFNEVYLILRCLVIVFTDTKDSQGVQASNIDEIAFNAVAVKWNPRDSNVKVCLYKNARFSVIFHNYTFHAYAYVNILIYF